MMCYIVLYCDRPKNRIIWCNFENMIELLLFKYASIDKMDIFQEKKQM